MKRRKRSALQPLERKVFECRTSSLLEAEGLPHIPLAEPCSSTATRCQRLLRKPMLDLSDSDLLFLLQLQQGAQHLVPMAILRLEESLFRKAHRRSGDLLHATLRLPPSFWAANPDYWKALFLLMVPEMSRVHALTGRDLTAFLSLQS